MHDIFVETKFYFVKTDDNIKIIDEVFFLGKSSLVMFFVTPILILPIFLRKILYKTYTWN